LSPDSGVLFLGYLPMAKLSALLGGSIAVVYPSVGEGFGLPVLEAMASGAAVITTQKLAIPEVGGDAVMYVEPTAAKIRDAMMHALQDVDGRQQLQAQASRRASLFTWHATAARHVVAYDLAAAARSRRS
jgi:glycosyltransferase involved in cell wall biosynthesis